MNATRPLTATWMLTHAGFTGARKTSAAHAFNTAAKPAWRRPIRTASTMQAAASPESHRRRDEVGDAVPRHGRRGPSGVPIGNPFSGSMTNTPEATSPSPKTAISGANQRRPTPSLMVRRTPTARHSTPMPATMKLAICTKPGPPVASWLSGCRRRSNPSRSRTWMGASVAKTGPASSACD